MLIVWRVSRFDLQQCRSQVNRPGVNREQPKGPPKPSGVLQEKEVPPSRSPAEEDEGYPKTVDCCAYPQSFIALVAVTRSNDFVISQHEKKLKTKRQHNKDIHFPKRKYAVKAD
jgi:hypothetical protein